MTRAEFQIFCTALAVVLGVLWTVAAATAVASVVRRVAGGGRRLTGAAVGLLGAVVLPLVWTFTPETPAVLAPLGAAALLTQAARGLTLWGTVAAWRAAEAPGDLPPPPPGPPDFAFLNGGAE